jgi:hypothetical protein
LGRRERGTRERERRRKETLRERNGKREKRTTTSVC